MISESIAGKVKKPKQRYILKNNKKWFNHYREYIESGVVLHVGNGLGYASELMKEKNPKIISVDISIHPDTINKDDVVIYDGKLLPYDNDYFDVLLCDYVVHHTPNPEEFLNELKRVVKKDGILIIIEQTHTNLWQRLKLLYSCWKQNSDTEQKVEIHWRSYFSRKSIRSTFMNMGFEILDTISEQRRSSYTELFVLRK